MSMNKSHLDRWIYQKHILIFLNWFCKVFFENSVYNPKLTIFLLKICDEFGMICTIRCKNFHYLIPHILEKHIHNPTFWIKNDTSMDVIRFCWFSKNQNISFWRSMPNKPTATRTKRNLGGWKVYRM